MLDTHSCIRISWMSDISGNGTVRISKSFSSMEAIIVKIKVYRTLEFNQRLATIQRTFNHERWLNLNENIKLCDFLKIYLSYFLAVVGLNWCTRAFSSCGDCRISSLLSKSLVHLESQQLQNQYSRDLTTTM